PGEGSNDSQPVWVGDTIYFLSDRDWAVNVWAYDTTSGELRQLTRFKEFDAKSLEAGGGWLVFEQAGYIHRLDTATGESVQVPIEVRGDFAWARPHWEEVGEDLRLPALSPSGKRAIFEARGEIFTVPAEKGDARNLTSSPDAADRAPAWSPDGKWVSWFSDESGEYQLVIADQKGADRRVIELADPTFFYTPVWSPDSEYLSFGDADRNLWLLEIASGERTRIDDEGYAIPGRTIYPAWSPDSKWIAYTRRLDNLYNAVFIYDVEAGTRHALTDGLSDARSPAWDAGGRYLYFLASTDLGLNVGWLEMGRLDHQVNHSVYAAVLVADQPSPLEPESDEEEVEEESGEEEEDEKEDGEKNGDAPEVHIDFDGLERRIVALGIPAGNYLGLDPAGEGVLFYAERVEDGDSVFGGGGFTLHRYKLEDRESEPFLAGITAAVVSADGEKLLYGTPDDSWGIVETGGSAEVGDGKIDTAGLRMKVDPAAEWRQIFRESWRYQRDYFYVDNVHGLDLDRVWEKYAPWLDHVRHRTDLTHLLDILGGETAIGHSFTFGGDNPDVESVPVGLLGADLEAADGRYRIARIYRGESWNPELRAPLSGPGIDVDEGDYLLAVDGVELTAADNPYSL
ncbi:MAG: PDZ domain-containing protein, partial [Thermoanaerobaculia bacterium]